MFFLGFVAKLKEGYLLLKKCQISYKKGFFKLKSGSKNRVAFISIVEFNYLSPTSTASATGNFLCIKMVFGNIIKSLISITFIKSVFLAIIHFLQKTFVICLEILYVPRKTDFSESINDFTPNYFANIILHFYPSAC